MPGIENHAGPAAPPKKRRRRRRGKQDPTPSTTATALASSVPGVEHSTAAERERPLYQLADGPANVRWLRSELGTENLPGVFMRGGRLVYVASITDDGYIQPQHPEDDNGPATVTPLTALGLSTRVGDTYSVVKYDGRTKRDKPAHFPNEDCARVMETVERLPYIRPLRGVAHTPIARPTSGLLTEAGYDEESGHLLEPTVIVDPPSAAPTDQQVEKATEFLRGLVAEFVWGDDDSEANFWGCMLTPLLRLACPPPYKLAAITARERGSGKSLLAELLRIVHGGSLSTWPSNDDEVHKTISSKLHCTTAPVQQIDNVRGVLQSGRLEALATSLTYSVRVLGSTNEFELVNDRLWCFTGNNMVISGDLGRRMLWIDLDPGVEKPELRDNFAIPELARYVQVNRPKVLKALLTLIAAWDAQGRPTGKATSDSYGRWTAAVRSILEIAGIPGTFNNPADDRAEGLNPEEAEWAEFLQSVHAHYGAGTRWTVKQMTDAMSSTWSMRGEDGDGTTGEGMREALPAELHDKASKANDGARAIKKSLGKWLSFRKGQWCGGYTVQEAGKESGTKSAYWRVMHRDDVLPVERGQ